MINNLKDLQALLKLCRKHGVTDIKLGGVEISLGDIHETQGSQSLDPAIIENPGNPYANFPTGELTPEQLAFYSAGGNPEDDPENKEAM